MNNLEDFSESELKTYKKLCFYLIVISVLAIISIVFYYISYRYNENRLMYCYDTGLYKTIKGNQIIAYTEDSEEAISKNESIKAISEQYASSICLYFLGKDFDSNLKFSGNCTNYVKVYLDQINTESIINIGDYFNGIEYNSFIGSDELLYYPYKIENGIRYSRHWVTNNESMSVTDFNNITDKIKSEIPEQVRRDYGDDEIIGYIPYEEKLSDCMSDKVFEKDGQYFINVKDLEVDGTNGYVYYFEEQTIDLMTLEPSKELREINPDDRFTWIMQDDLTEVKGDWCYTYFKNKHYEELGIIKVKVKGNEAVDIEISGFE